MEVNKMNISVKKISALLVCISFLAAAFFGLLSLDASAVTLTGHEVSGLLVEYEDQSHSSAKNISNWSASSGELSWTNTTTKTGFITKKYYYKAAELTLTNNTEDTLVLSFAYEVSINGGSATIDGAPVETNGAFSKTLSPKGTIKIYVETSKTEEKKTSITLTGIELSVKTVTVTFANPVNGSYAVDGVKIDDQTEKTDVSTKTYSLVATSNDNYVFEGWYVGGGLASTEKIWTTSFADTCTVEAKFSVDPLYAQATVPSDSAYTKEQLVTVNSEYFHDSSTMLYVPGGMPVDQSAYSLTSATQVKDAYDVQYVPSRKWSTSNSSVAFSYSGKATGDFVSNPLEERGWSYARIHSDVIQIYAKENCKISFNYAHGISGSGTIGTSLDGSSYSKLYYIVSSSDNVTVAQIKTGEAVTAASGKIENLSLSAGDCLYIVTEGYAVLATTMSSGYMSFSCSASISNFTVAYNESKVVLDVGFQDNIGGSLTSGQIVMNSVSYDINAIEALELAEGAEVDFRIGAVPNGYVHIGWAKTVGGELSNQYTDTYSCKLTADTVVKAIFVPQMIITMGNDGYNDAAYTLLDGSATSGQYVARNVDRTAYYTTLKQAFENTNVVVLLASDTINGVWSIPKGKTLVIPNALTDQGGTELQYTTTGYIGVYCQLTITGNLTVDGSLLVNAQQYFATGICGGTFGQVTLNPGATVTVNGTLYGYGPIVGAGEIIANASAVVHESIEIGDVAGGVTTNSIYEGRKSKHVFPVNNLFLNNIESRMTLYAGAVHFAHAVFSFDTTDTVEIALIGSSDAMFNISSGSVTKYYDAATGRTIIRVNEGAVVETGSFSLDIQATMGTTTQTVTLTSSEYYFPLNASWKIDVAGQMTINNYWKFLPGFTMDVLTSGIVTISEDANVVFYRMNDYDNRGRRPSSTECWGYSMFAYPINSGRYPYTFNADNIGSAKLNVDGKLIVNGGLYVTNSLQTAGNGIVIRENGYNYLTGQGTIDMTGANTDLESINEFMLCQTNAVDWATVKVVSMKGLKPDATADEASQYVSLTGKSGGVTNGNGLNVWLTGAPELNVAYRLNDYLWFNGYFTEDYIVNPTTSIGLSGDSLQTAVSSGKCYVVKSIPADEIPNDLTFTLTFTAPDGATYSRNFTVNLATYSAGDDEELKQALLAYGDAAKDYFGNKTSNGSGKPSVSNTLISPDDKEYFAQTLGNVGINTIGASIYFDEALRLSVKYQLSNATSASVTINGETYTIVQIGMLVQKLDNWNMANVLTTDPDKCSATAYIVYNTAGVTITPGGADNRPNNSFDGEAAADLKTFKASGEITFDLKAQDYKSGFAIRTYAVLQKGEGDSAEYVCVYGKQYGYGLEAYINAMYVQNATEAEDKSYNNLLEKTWALAAVAAG